MTIIQEGKLPEPCIYIYRGTCSHCQCKVEVDETELKIKGKGEQVVCPTTGCHSNIAVTFHANREIKPRPRWNMEYETVLV